MEGELIQYTLTIENMHFTVDDMVILGACNNRNIWLVRSMASNIGTDQGRILGY